MIELFQDCCVLKSTLPQLFYSILFCSLTAPTANASQGRRNV